MTEAEWLESSDIEQMLQCLVERRFPDAKPCDWKRGEWKKRLFVRAYLSLSISLDRDVNFLSCSCCFTRNNALSTSDALCQWRAEYL
jgi:hypothetical protein